MKRLSALDALFLYLETPETPMHVASLTIFEPGPPGVDLFARFRAHTEARLDVLPSYRRRLEPTPLGLDHPVWVVDGEVDLDRHIRRAVLPAPGGMAQLNALVAELHAVPLDRARPLWAYTFIEGLAGGGFAVYLKVHHASMDGVAGMGMLGVVYDFAKGGGGEPEQRRAVPPERDEADGFEIAGASVGDFVRMGVRAVKALPSFARALARTSPNLVRDAKFLYGYVKDMPRTPFNVAISGRRSFAFASLPLHRVKAVARSRGATVNDVVLALVSGALRRYLSDRGALPEKPLTAGVPASLRAQGDAQLNNQVVFTVSKLPTDVAEPLPRLAAAKAAGDEAKHLFADLRAFITTDVSILGAPLAITALARAWAGARAANWVWPVFNLVVSNVPGPREPMYCAGAKATHYIPISIPFNGGALNITVQSYLDTLDFGLIACSDAVPDVQRIADFLAEDFSALAAADAKAPRPDLLEGIARALAAKPATPQPVPPDAQAHSAERDRSVLARRIDALATATEALRRKLAGREAAAPETPRPKRAPSRRPARPAGKGPQTGAADAPAPKAPAGKAPAGKRPARKRTAGKRPAGTGRARAAAVAPEPPRPKPAPRRSPAKPAGKGPKTGAAHAPATKPAVRKRPAGTSKGRRARAPVGEGADSET